MADPVVTDKAEEHRYEIAVDGKVAGFIDYHDRGDRRALNHTEIDPAYEGQGLASTIARAALDDIRAHGKVVLPYCPFVRSYIDKHRDEYVDLVPEDEREKFNLR
jgi:predicted GNAT family acetyltransferase